MGIHPSPLSSGQAHHILDKNRQLCVRPDPVRHPECLHTRHRFPHHLSALPQLIRRDHILAVPGKDHRPPGTDPSQQLPRPRLKKMCLIHQNRGTLFQTALRPNFGIWQILHPPESLMKPLPVLLALPAVDHADLLPCRKLHSHIVKSCNLLCMHFAD